MTVRAIVLVAALGGCITGNTVSFVRDVHVAGEALVVTKCRVHAVQEQMVIEECHDERRPLPLPPSFGPPSSVAPGAEENPR